MLPEAAWLSFSVFRLVQRIYSGSFKQTSNILEMESLLLLARRFDFIIFRCGGLTCNSLGCFLRHENRRRPFTDGRCPILAVLFHAEAKRREPRGQTGRFLFLSPSTDPRGQL